MEFSQGPELGDRRHIGFSERRETLPVLGCPLARHVEEVVAHEDTRQIDVGAQAPQFGIHVVAARIQLIELDVDLLRPGATR